MKQMRRVILIFVILTMLLPSVLGAFALSTDTGLTVAAADNCYAAYAPGTTTLPLTFEATVSFPAGTTASTRGGVIYGSYVNGTTPCFNFEIHKNGNPRLYAISTEVDASTGKNIVYDVKFTDANVYTGEPVHIAITVDAENGLWKCYIDGALVQIVEAAAPAAYDLTCDFCLGGDTRSGNSQYFKGTIHNVAFYSDIRTAQEIEADAIATAATVDTTGLTHYYDLSGVANGTLPTTVTSPLNLGPTFQKGRPGENPAWWIVDKAPVTDYAYSFAVVGDPQILNLNYPEKMSAMYEWIAANKESKNIQYCLTLGDLTDDNTKAEYDRIEEAFKKLDDAGLPYGFIRGNHDEEAQYDSYVTYAEHGNKTAESGTFDGTMKNTWQKLTVGEVKYLFVNVDYQNTSAELAPISAFIAQNPDYNVIVATHVYMSSNSNLTEDLRWEQTDTAELSGIDFWEQLMSRHDNIVMVLCGHSPSATIVRRTAQNVNGYAIPQILIDCQDEDLALGGLGMVAMFYFSEDGSHVQVEHYSVDRDAYYRAQSQFSMTLNTVNADGSVTPASPITPNYTKTYRFARSTLRNSLGKLSFVGLRDTVVSMLANEYDAGYRDTKIEALHSGFNAAKSAAFNVSSDRLYMGYTAYVKNDPKWVAMRLRAPGAGTYEINISSGTVDETDLRTGTPMNAYLIPASKIPADATADTYSALRTDANKIGYYEFGRGNITGSYGIHTLESGDYILILEAAYPTKTTGWTKEDDHVNFLAANSLELKTVVASIGSTYYTSLDNAFAAANADDTVKLEQPYVGELNVPTGVSLDLNGNRCTATEFTAASSAEYIIDSKGNGVLDIDTKSLFGNNNGYLPLYNTEKDGYSFHSYTFNVPADDNETTGNTARFWFYVSFTDKAVYDLIAAGDTGVSFGVDLAWGEKTLDVAFADDLAAQWAAAAKNNENVWLYVDVKGLENLGDAELTVTPTIELEGHTYELTNGTVTYTVG